MDPTFVLLFFRSVFMVFIRYIRYGSHCLRKWIPSFFQDVPRVFFVFMSHTVSYYKGRCGSFVLNQTPKRAEADLSSSLPLAAPAQGRLWMLPWRFRLTIVQGLARLRTNLVEIFTHPASPCRLHPRGRAWWIHVDPRGSMWTHMDPCGSTWIHMYPCGSTCHVDPCGPRGRRMFVGFPSD